MNDWWQQHEHSRPQRERRSEVEMNRPEGTGDPGGGDHPEIFFAKKGQGATRPTVGTRCSCALHEFRGGTVCGVGGVGFASFPCKTDILLEE
jgi:hypothetical protein